MNRLKAAAAKAAARAAAAKEQVRSAKARLKQARKSFKVEKRAAKQARKKVDAAAAVAAPGQMTKPAAVAKPAVAKPTVAKTTVAKPAVAKPSVRKRAPAAKPARPLSRSTPKPRARKSPETMRSAAEVAKSVIERLHSPPPTLPPTPIVSTDPAPAAAPARGDTETGA